MGEDTNSHELGVDHMTTAEGLQPLYMGPLLKPLGYTAAQTLDS